VKYAATGAQCWTNLSRCARIDEKTACTGQLLGDVTANRMPRVIAMSYFGNFPCTKSALLPWLKEINKSATDEFPVMKLLKKNFIISIFADFNLD